MVLYIIGFKVGQSRLNAVFSCEFCCKGSFHEGDSEGDVHVECKEDHVLAIIVCGSLSIINPVSPVEVFYDYIGVDYGCF